jgi:hypothetical protein
LMIELPSLARTCVNNPRVRSSWVSVPLFVRRARWEKERGIGAACRLVPSEVERRPEPEGAAGRKEGARLRTFSNRNVGHVLKCAAGSVSTSTSPTTTNPSELCATPAAGSPLRATSIDRPQIPRDDRAAVSGGENTGARRARWCVLGGRRQRRRGST